MSLHPILLECCGDNGRYDLTQPFAWGHWAYATDGRIIVRQANAAEFAPVVSGRKIPDPDRMIAEWMCPRSPRPIPECPEWKHCEACKGSGLITTGELCCEECGNIYVLRFKGQPVHYECLDCCGKGTQPNDDPIRVADSPNIYFQAHYLGMIRWYGVWEMNVAMTEKYPAHFLGDGFEGWLMPMKAKTVEAKMRERARA